MELLHSKTVENFLSDSEIEKIQNLILDVSINDEYYQTVGGTDKLVAQYNIWNYNADNAKGIRDILDTKFNKIFNNKSIILNSHILNAHYPYQLHSDYVHTDIKNNITEYRPGYTFIIPLETYDSRTYIFNEYLEKTNEFSVFKEHYQGELSLRLDKSDAKRLSHIHPTELFYLTLKEVFYWNKGSLHAFDRRYIHCSDNFLKTKHQIKRGLILWVSDPI